MTELFATEGPQPDPSRFPRVLMVTVNPLSTSSNNGKTFASFFEGYPKDSIAQLFFHREVPTSPVCDRYYRIGDEDFYPWLARRTRTLGHPAQRGSVAVGAPGDGQPVRDRLKKSALARLLRSISWTRLSLEAPGVKDWLDDYAPDVVFFCGGDANYLYEPVLKFCRRTGAKLIYYITDDYVLPAPSASPPARLTRRWTRREFLRTIDASSLVLTIGDAMTERYRTEFGAESTPIMNLVDLPAEIPVRAAIDARMPVLRYMGGLHLNRWRTLLAVADSLQRLSESGEPTARLVVNAPSVPAEAESAFDSHPFLAYEGAVPAAEVPECLVNSDLLLHVESFDEDDQTATLLSVSTKIPEYLATGRAVVAMAPEELASLQYLKRAGAAFTITSQEPAVIDSTLRTALTDQEVRESHIRHGVELLRTNHEASAQRTWLFDEIRRMCETSEPSAR